MGKKLQCDATNKEERKKINYNLKKYIYMCMLEAPLVLYQMSVGAITHRQVLFYQYI